MTDDSAARPARPSMPELDLAAADAMWQAYAAAHPGAAAAGAEHTVERFGDSPRFADALLDIVLRGEKRATSEVAAQFVADGAALPRAASPARLPPLSPSGSAAP